MGLEKEITKLLSEVGLLIKEYKATWHKSCKESRKGRRTTNAGKQLLQEQNSSGEWPQTSFKKIREEEEEQNNITE